MYDPAKLNNNYFFVDGSTLLADAKRIRSTLGIAATARLRLVTAAQLLVASTPGQERCRRFVYYFVQNDERLQAAVELPDPTVPRHFPDLRIEFCGKRIAQFDRAKKWLDEFDAPDFVRESLYRSEKAVDTQICCDALHLVANGRLDRLFLYTNDFDFVPLCRTLRQLGANIDLLRLRAVGVNAALAAECDGLYELNEYSARSCFAEPTVVPPAAG